MGLKVIWREEVLCGDRCGNLPPFNSTWPDLFSYPKLRLAPNFPGSTPCANAQILVMTGSLTDVLLGAHDNPICACIACPHLLTGDCIHRVNHDLIALDPAQAPGVDTTAILQGGTSRQGCLLSAVCGLPWIASH